MSKTAHEIELITNANKYIMGKALVNRLVELINKSKEEDKIRLAINYSHSVTKSQMRGSK